MNRDVRDRLLLPVVIPLASLAAIVILAIGFSRILLAVPKATAPLVALVVAAAALFGGAGIAARARTGIIDLAAAFGLAAMVAGGLVVLPTQMTGTFVVG